ncbi:MAG: hypothetical protein N2561_00125 [Bacteroidetes bacterium]|nr:hypothetical protein [Rhodothermia bacterium]MCX7905934.1 hypothetical protein [Bacteroidota bacterium]MDW8138099.1 hypothetical protein [Bacteroidota bacterium]MDW8285783.1 hypothetical protein [Bacteroidota bacterium]
MKPTTYVSTPGGILTAEGVWFYANEEALRAYAGPVLERVPLEQVLAEASTWYRSGWALGIVLLPLLLWKLPWWVATLTTLGLYVLWELLKPAWYSEALARVFYHLQQLWLQFLLYLIVLSVLLMTQQWASAATGLAGFVLFRYGIIDWLARHLLGPLKLGWYHLPEADAILRGRLLRYAIRLDVALPHLEEMRQRILEFWQRR